METRRRSPPELTTSFPADDFAAPPPRERTAHLATSTHRGIQAASSLVGRVLWLFVFRGIDMGQHSPRTALIAELHSLAKKAGGSHLTVESREACMNTFAEHLKAHGFTIASVHQIKLKHIVSYVRAREDDGTQVRTIHNLVTHLRTTLRAAGRAQFVREQLSSKQLGLEKSCRDGTKVAIRNPHYEDKVALAIARDLGIAAGMMLCRELGLRGQEAIMSVKHLDSWRASLEGQSALPLIVSAGTKGGRVRELPVSLIPNREAALQAVIVAQQVAAERGGRLIDKPTLKQAVDKWDNEMRAIGLTGKLSGHSLRYAFAVAAIERFQAQGLSEKRALELTSCLLGHGEGRGRWVRQVYSRTEEADE